MKIGPKKGASYQLSKVGQMVSATVSINDEQPTVLSFVDAGEMSKIRAKNPGVRGRPMVAWLDDESMIHLFPGPDTDAELTVRFYPPMVTV